MNNRHTPRKRALSYGDNASLASWEEMSSNSDCADELFRAGKHSQKSSFSQNSQTSHNGNRQNATTHHTECADNDDDEYSLVEFSQALEISPSYGEVTTGMSKLSISQNEETGDEDQMKAIELAKQGKNIFLTGKAGTGKSWTTQKIIQECEKQNKIIHVTAPTGIAAINVNGETIHSWGGFSIGEKYSDFDQMMAKKIREKIKKTDVLIIDEISMLDGQLLDVLEFMVSYIRHYDSVKDRVRVHQKIDLTKDEVDKNESTETNGRSIVNDDVLQMRWKLDSEGGLGDIDKWGGMQLIVVGDFFQLPPVPSYRKVEGDGVFLEEDDDISDTDYQVNYKKVGRQGCYAFESHAWQKSGFHMIELKKSHRQADINDGFLPLLNAMREANDDFTDKHKEALNALKKPLPTKKLNGKILATELHSKNKDVRKENKMELKKLKHPEISFESVDEVEFSFKYKQRLSKKYRLTDVMYHLPLFASVEKPPPPPNLVEVLKKLKVLKEMKRHLLVIEDYASLVSIKKEIDTLEDQVKTIEREEEEKSIITVHKIKKVLKEHVPDKTADADAMFERYQKFKKHLSRDFLALQNHSNQTFFDGHCPVGSTITLKEEAQVMLLWNLDIPGKLANGSRGAIVDFFPTNCYYHLLQKEVKKRQQEESKKGKKLDESEKNICDSDGGLDDPIKVIDDTDLDGFNNVQGESTWNKSKSEKNRHDVVLDKSETSKCDLFSTPTSPSHESEDVNMKTTDKVSDDCDENDTYDYSSVDPKLLEEIKNTLEHMEDQNIDFELKAMDKVLMGDINQLPYVEFCNETRRLILLKPFSKRFHGCGVAARWQIPLTLAWSISIHKSQGMTIDYLRVNLKGCFSDGQAYVACSRGRSLDSIHVINFHPSEVKASEKVHRFYKSYEEGGTPYTETWRDTIEDFDNRVYHNRKVKEALEKSYKDVRCRSCGQLCVVKQAQTNRNGNQGKWYVQCPDVYSSGHTFEFVPEIPYANFSRNRRMNGNK